MRRLFASTLLALGLSGGAAVAAPWHGGREIHHGPVYRDPGVRAFHRGFDRGRWGGERHEIRRDGRFHRWDRR